MSNLFPKHLPTPSEEAIHHSRRLIDYMREQMSDAGGSVSFCHFMEMALYAPGLGYYAAGAAKFGAAGDFITAPEISPLFCQCLARQCVPIIEIIANAEILEFGAGSGTLALELLLELERLQRLPERYLILEISADLRERQRRLLATKAPHLIERVQWLDSLPQAGFYGIIIANEVLDAMPVHRLRVSKKDIFESCVGFAEDKFVWREKPIKETNPFLLEQTKTLTQSIQSSLFEHDYIMEVNFSAQAWVKTIASTLKQGLALIIDYGFPQREFYHPDRFMGTLMCHYRHFAHADPLVLIGLQDITTHINFTALAEVAYTNGLVVAGYTTQANFLLATGIVEMIAASDPENVVAHLNLTRQIKLLTLPSEMGELFKVLALSRAIQIDLIGFSNDQRQRL